MIMAAARPMHRRRLGIWPPGGDRADVDVTKADVPAGLLSGECLCSVCRVCTLRGALST